MKIFGIRLTKDLIPSLVVAFYVVIPTLNLIVVHIEPSLEGTVMSLLYAVGGGAAVITSLFCKKVRLSTSFLMVLVTLLIAYYLTPDFGSEKELTTPYFLMFTLVPFIIPQFIGVDARLMALFAMIVPSFGVFFPLELFVLNSQGMIQMDLSYSLLVPIVSTFVYLFLYWKNDNKLVKILVVPFVICNIVYLVYVALFGSRAPVMSALLCVFFLYVFHHKSNDIGVVVNKRRLRISIITIFFFIIGFISIATALEGLLDRYGIEAGALEKISRLQGDGDLSNGRGSVSSIAFNGFLESPIWGHGLSSSPKIIKQVHPHNFILQFLFDGGIILALIILLPMVRSLRRWSKKCNYNDYAIITLMFFSSVVGALFSLDVWMNARLWLFFGFLFSNKMSFNNFRLFRK